MLPFFIYVCMCGCVRDGERDYESGRGLIHKKLLWSEGREESASHISHGLHSHWRLQEVVWLATLLQHREDKLIRQQLFSVKIKFTLVNPASHRLGRLL